MTGVVLVEGRGYAAKATTAVVLVLFVRHGHQYKQASILANKKRLGPSILQYYTRYNKRKQLFI